MSSPRPEKDEDKPGLAVRCRSDDGRIDGIMFIPPLGEAPTATTDCSSAHTDSDAGRRGATCTAANSPTASGLVTGSSPHIREAPASTA